jgi:F-box protein 11
MAARQPLAFLSYAHSDDEHENGRLRQFAERLSGEVRLQWGEEFPIFIDRKDLKWGQEWKSRIDKSLDGVTFLISILTPGYFKSEYCRKELERFLEREKRLDRSDLILPVYYVRSPVLEDGARREQDTLARTLHERQYKDWRRLRHEPWTTPDVGRQFEQMALEIVDALERAGLAPADAPAPVGPRSASSGSAKNLRSGKPRKTDHAVAREAPAVIVDAMNRGDYASISAAIQGVQTGTRILIRPGTYRESLVIDKTVEIVGEGNAEDIVIQSTGNHVIEFTASMGRIANLTLRQMGGGNWNAVHIASGRLDLEDCDITCQSNASVAIKNGADPRLRRNRIHDGKGGGVYVYQNGAGLLEDNDIFANALAGVFISTGSNPTLRRNRIRDGKQGGVKVFESGIGLIEDNEIFGNGQSGIVIGESGNPVVRRNRIHDGREGGVFVHDDGAGLIEDNELFGNELSGILIASGANPIVRRNRIHDGRQNGILVYENGVGLIEDNDILTNKYSGIEVREGGNPTARGNRINGNREGVQVHKKGRGIFEQNVFADNKAGNWDIAADCKRSVKRIGNIES